MKTVEQYILELEKWQEEVLFLREIILDTGLTECIKWGTPTFMWENKNVVSIAAHKHHVSIWFFQGGLLKDEAQLLINTQEGETKAMLQWKIESLEQIVNAPVVDYILESIAYFKNGLTIKTDTKPKPILSIPTHLQEALSSDALLSQKWDTLSPACKREYAQFINDAQREETKYRRIEKIMPMILLSKGLNDQYKK